MAEHKMQLEDWLDDLCVRFIIHLPKEDLSSVARICFQVEEAQWFYEDFIRPLDPTLPSMSLRSFCLRIFQHCPLLAPFSVENHMRAFEEFLQYKTRVPVRGAILLNEAMDATVLVKGWKKGANWSFPRGKINKDEDDLDCAIREVYEETGFDIKQAGLVPKDDDVKYIQISMREQQIRLYVFRNIPMDTVFEPKTRKEISKVEWYKLSELPAFRKKGNAHDDAAAASNANKFYMVAPFLVPLKKWVVQQKKKDAAKATANNSQLAVQAPAEEPLTEDDIGVQAEPLARPSDGTPAIETLEGATRELQRLLKVQPPTQGLQIGQPTASNKPDKGEALMALLQKGTEGQPQQTQPQENEVHQVPHTPFDLTYTSPPEPHSPHHHHPTQRLPAPNAQPPPAFPFPPSSIHAGGPQAYFPLNRAPPQSLPQVYGRNPVTNPAQLPRAEPVLLHPQPLPPQVQQSLLTRGILPTPGLSETAGQAPGPPQHASSLNGLTAGRGNTYAPQQLGGRPTQLTGHALALLNVFKGGSRDQVEAKEGGNTHQGPVVHAAPQQRSSQQHQSQPAPWSGIAATQALNPAAQFLPQHAVPVAPAGTSPHAVQARQMPAAPKLAQPVDPHRSALLDMFKRSGPRSPPSNEIGFSQKNARQSPGFSRGEEPGSPHYKRSAALEAVAETSEAKGGPARVSPDVKLPYRPVQILHRPKPAESGKPQDYASTQAQMQRLQQRISPPGPAQHESRHANSLHGMASARDRMFTQKPEQELISRRSPQPKQTAAQAASLPYLHQSPPSKHSVPSFYQQQPAPTVLPRRKESNSEQRQKLLSLFGKDQQQPSPTGISADEKGKGKEPAVFDQPRSGTPRPRMASLASAGGNEPLVGSASNSRRGSQTPISPADRSFLLSYLESVTSSGR